mmetsp:Transcript_5657/g.13727  ORF Transcript_5657/g.13727 Transcript_5657/m.13727 type:complete len:276 (-) Transcript_5657:52-879(-)
MRPVGCEEDGGDVDEGEAEEAEPDGRLGVSHRAHLFEIRHHIPQVHLETRQAAFPRFRVPGLGEQVSDFEGDGCEAVVYHVPRFRHVRGFHVPLDIVNQPPEDLLNLPSDLPVPGLVERLEDEVRRENGPLEVRQRRERALPPGERRLHGEDEREDGADSDDVHREVEREVKHSLGAEESGGRRADHHEERVPRRCEPDPLPHERGSLQEARPVARHAAQLPGHPLDARRHDHPAVDNDPHLAPRQTLIRSLLASTKAVPGVVNREASWSQRETS